MIYFNKKYCNTVTTFYFNVVIDALREAGQKVVIIDSYNTENLKIISKDDYILETKATELLKLSFKGFGKFIYWFQGIIPEEDYMRFHSKWRRFIMSFAEKQALKKSEYILFVSHSMKEHYTRKYKMDFSNRKTFIMPCFNTIIEKAAFYKEGKYKNNIFCYAGAVSIEWQCFEEVVDTYKAIENKYRDNVKLKILTKEQQEAITILTRKGVKNYEVKFVPANQVPQELAECKFGFLIRHNHPVNYVATPTKISAYMASGVILLYTSAVNDFAMKAKEMKYVIKLDSDYEQKLNQFIEENIPADDVFAEYNALMGSYFNAEKYKKELSEWFDM